MDAAQQAQLGAQLDRALAECEINIERAQVAGGNVQCWVRVPGAAVLGRLLAVTGWRVRHGSYDSAPHLHLIAEVEDGED